jgi:hypothetical protein
MPTFTGILRTINQLLTAGIAISAFSLLLYALSFNLRDRVVRTFAIIMVCVVIVFVCEAIASVTDSSQWTEIWLKLQWIGITFLPSAYAHFSDALLSTTGRPSRGRRRDLIRVSYGISVIFLVTLYTSQLVGSLISNGQPAPHLERTSLTWVFAGFYAGGMIWAWVNFFRAYRRTVTPTSRRRMRYLILGAFAPALGSYPYLLFGSGFAAANPTFFWFAAIFSNFLVSILLFVMAYGVAFFGVPWPDRVVKRRLFKWIMRGPVSASSVLAVVTIVRRAGANLGTVYSAAVPISMVATLLLMQYMITMLAPIWERWLFYGGDRDRLQLIQTLEERLLTTSDLRQFLESVLTAVCDRLQVTSAFVMALGSQGIELAVTIGNVEQLQRDDLSQELLQEFAQNGSSGEESFRLFSWGDFWLVPLFDQNVETNQLLGLLGVIRNPQQAPDEEQIEALTALGNRAAIALADRVLQQQVFSSLENLTPQVDMIQRLRAAASHDGTDLLASPDTQLDLEPDTLSMWVKDALSHYWGGPKLTGSPLLRLEVVQQASREHGGVTVNALRSILKQGIDKVRPEGERRFTAEWILYNILEMKFLEGRKVREVAMRLAMSEADLYRKQRVAVEAVANAIVDMEQQAREEVRKDNGLKSKDRFAGKS